MPFFRDESTNMPRFHIVLSFIKEQRKNHKTIDRGPRSDLRFDLLRGGTFRGSQFLQNVKRLFVTPYSLVCLTQRATN
jgi:hypothetical protein